MYYVLVFKNMFYILLIRRITLHSRWAILIVVTKWIEDSGNVLCVKKCCTIESTLFFSELCLYHFFFLQIVAYLVFCQGILVTNMVSILFNKHSLVPSALPHIGQMCERMENTHSCCQFPSWIDLNPIMLWFLLVLQKTMLKYDSECFLKK